MFDYNGVDRDLERHVEWLRPSLQAALKVYGHPRRSDLAIAIATALNVRIDRFSGASARAMLDLAPLLADLLDDPPESLDGVGLRIAMDSTSGLGLEDARQALIDFGGERIEIRANAETLPHVLRETLAEELEGPVQRKLVQWVAEGRLTLTASRSSARRDPIGRD